MAARAAVDAQPLILEHLSTQQGLPQGTVMTTLQDSQGFIWLGTEDGVVRYDGREVRVYAARRNDPDGLPSNFVNDLAEDAHGDLWIAIKGGGVARWNRSTDKFTVYRHEPGNADSLASDQVRAILLDRQGRLWIGLGNTGIDVLDTRAAQAHFRHYRHDSALAASLGDDEVYALFQDRNDTIWIGTHGGLDRWQPAGDDFTHFRVGSNTTEQGFQGVSAITQDRNGALWVATYHSGLHQLDATGHVLQSYTHERRDSSSLSDNDVRAVLEDQSGHLWVGTANGLDLLDRSSGRFNHYRHDPAIATSLLDSFVMSLYQDANGLLWIGTRSGGVSRWNPRSWELGGHRPAWLENKMVTAFAEAPGNALWVASMGGGLVKVDISSGEWADIDVVTGRRNALGDNRVMSLLRDRNGELWIGTMSGLRRLSRNGSIVSLPTHVDDPFALSNAGVMHLYESRSGKIWVGTHGGGANIVDPATLRVRQLPAAAGGSGGLSHGIVTAIAEDNNGNVWIGTDGGGLNLAHADGTVVHVFRHDKENAHSLSSDAIYALSLDGRGRLWVATDGGGLELVEGNSNSPASISFRNWSKADGLSGDTVYSVVPDGQGRLWLSGNNGLMRFDPGGGGVKTWHREQGLQGDEFNYGAWFRTADGRLCFGGPGGFNVFDPEHLTENSVPPRVVLTSLSVQGAELSGSVPTWQLARHTLDYDQNVVSLKFVALDFTSPERNRLQYRLDTLGDRWWDFSAERTVPLNNLESGEHLLEVRAASVDSVWSSTPYTLRLNKRPAPWISWWAWCGYALLLALAIAFAVRGQRLKLRSAAETQRTLEAEVAQRTRELQRSNHKLAEASQAKSDFLARMGHELRTPMNGVVGMTELLTRTHLTEAQLRLTGTIRASARTLLQILNDLLDLSKINAGKIQLESLPVNLTQLMEEVATLFAASAEAKKLELVVCPPAEQGWMVKADSLRLRQVLMNLLGNAIKFTSQGEVVLRGQLELDEAQRARVRFTVTDTGIGMTPEAMTRIFEPFTQADETTTRRFGGTGLGLSICRELVELMGGTIRVDSQPDAGSTFTVDLQLPVHAEPQSLPLPELQGRAVEVLTRRRSLGEALDVYLRAAGLQKTAGEPVRNTLYVVDADSCASDLRSLLARGDGAERALVVVSSVAAADELGLARTLRPERLVRKPLGSEALRAALRSLVMPAGGPLTVPVREIQSLNAHVLIVDDEPVNAAVAEGYLAALGCTSVWVSDGSAAITRCAVERFDAVLMDINMSGIDGYVTTQRIREREPAGQRVPIIALTANEAAPYRERCLEAGMDEILSKPYTIAECVEVLRRLIPGSSRAVASTREGSDSTTATWSGESANAELLLEATGSVPTRRIGDALTMIDSAALARLRVGPDRGRGRLYGRLVDLFQATSSESVAAMRAALASGDLAACGAQAHKLRASAANVGATAFSDAARELEQACQAGAADRCMELFGRMAAVHPALLTELAVTRLRESA
jgi:signal transduction histidine kinase/ligand-binding sensor domain-containing protein/CheY-like chemotaxis protein/HPt (histidine-containing phosphotransfer) domain-containing protein